MQITKLDHVALYVKDMNWFIAFFRDCLKMKVKHFVGPEDCPDDIWFACGIQLTKAPDKPDYDGITPLAHFGIDVTDQKETINRCHEYGLRSDERGENWVWLPEGILMEILCW